jgi:choline dehydrogenase
MRGNVATGVEWIQGRRRHAATAASEVLLCAGSINSAQLMMLSGLGPPDHLRRHGISPCVGLPGVGANLQDHLMVPLAWQARTQSSLLDSRSVHSAVRYVLRRRGPLSSNVGQAGAFLRTGAGDAPDIQLVFAPVLLGDVRDEGIVEPTEHGFAIGVALLQPESRGTVRLRSADPGVAPLIQPAYLSRPSDASTLVRGLELAAEIGNQRPLRSQQLRARARGPEAGDGWRPHIRAHAETMFHPVGTCRMGIDEDAVVDEQLRVRGAERLRVVDASVMPTITRGNTHAPATMIAERAADLIRRSGPEPVDGEPTSRRGWAQATADEMTRQHGADGEPTPDR